MKEKLTALRLALALTAGLSFTSCVKPLSNADAPAVATPTFTSGSTFTPTPAVEPQPTRTPVTEISTVYIEEIP